MKKITTIVIILCLFVGIFSIETRFLNAKETTNDYTVETEIYSEEQHNELKNTNYVFSDEELKDTPYEGQRVEIIEGELYVNRSIILTIKIWLLTSGIPKLLGWLAANGTITLTTNRAISDELKRRVEHARDTYGNVTDAYADENQQLTSIKLSNGNECVPVSPTRYVCKF